MNRLKRAGMAVLTATAVTLATGRTNEGAQAPAAPTFNADIAPILFAQCVTCHRPGEVAPMSLLKYEDARPWARDIKAKVLAHEMPPWPADKQYGHFRNQHALTDAQIATLVAWVDAGAPQGEGSAPVPPTFVEGWTSQMNRPPDAVIEAPFEFELPASGEIPAFTVWMKAPFTGEKFIEAIELRPTNRAVVHHSNVLLAKLPAGAKLGRGEVWPGGPVLDGVPILRSGARMVPAVSEAFGKPLLFYVPAGGFLRFPKGVAKRVQADDYLVWGFHFMTSGKVERAGARIGLWFSQGAVQHEALTWTVTDSIAVNGKDVPRDKSGRQALPNIPPQTDQYTVTGTMKVTEDLTLYALWPHMHNRGRDMTFTLVDSRGREQTLLSVPRYDFQWQLTYELEPPLKIRAGSTIKAVAHYDNSPANRKNPDPNQEVLWGPQSSNEMFGPFLEIVYDNRNIRDPARSDCDSLRPSDPPGGGVAPPPCR